jgi:hypothetical protein
MVPTFTWGFVRSNFSLAIGAVSLRGPGCGRSVLAFAELSLAPGYRPSIRSTTEPGAGS